MPKVNETIVLGWDNPSGEGTQGVYVVLRDFDLQEKFGAIAEVLPGKLGGDLVYNLISHLLTEHYIAKADINTHVLYLTRRDSPSRHELNVFFEGRKQ